MGAGDGPGEQYHFDPETYGEMIADEVPLYDELQDDDNDYRHWRPGPYYRGYPPSRRFDNGNDFRRPPGFKKWRRHHARHHRHGHRYAD